MAEAEPRYLDTSWSLFERNYQEQKTYLSIYYDPVQSVKFWDIRKRALLESFSEENTRIFFLNPQHQPIQRGHCRPLQDLNRPCLHTKPALQSASREVSRRCRLISTYYILLMLYQYINHFKISFGVEKVYNLYTKNRNKDIVMVLACRPCSLKSTEPYTSLRL